MQIANTVSKGKISFKTIYNWIYSGLLTNTNLSVLRQKGKRHRPIEKCGKFLIRTSINKRPKEVKKREVFGQWKHDIINLYLSI